MTSDETNGLTKYRGWNIEFNPPPIPSRSCDWQFWHDSYDGAEDAGDNRCGSAPSLEAAKAEIDEREDELILASPSCPKCSLEAKALLHRFCTHAECPVRDALKRWRGEVQP